MKVLDILNIHGTLHEVMKQEIDHRLKFHLLGILHTLEEPVKNFEQIRNEKIREYGTEDSDGTITIDTKDTDTLTKFNQDIQSLLQEELPLTLPKISAEELFKSGLDIKYLVALYPIMNL